MKPIRGALIIFAGLLLSAHVLAEPSPVLSKFMDVPASAFDVYLFRLYEQSKCHQGWFGNQSREEKPDLCMTSIDYDFDDNLVVMNFFVGKSHDKMQGFSAASDKEKEEILKSILSGVAQTVGVESIGAGKYDIRLGMIQMTPIRHGWGTKNFDEVEVREEISKRTVLKLTANIGGLMYMATRSHHGKFSLSVEKSIVPDN